MYNYGNWNRTGDRGRYGDRNTHTNHRYPVFQGANPIQATPRHRYNSHTHLDVPHNTAASSYRERLDSISYNSIGSIPDPKKGTNDLKQFRSINNLNYVGGSGSGESEGSGTRSRNLHNLESKTRSRDDKLYIETRSISESVVSDETTMPGNSIIDTPLPKTSTSSSSRRNAVPSRSLSSRDTAAPPRRPPQRSRNLPGSGNIDEILMVPSDKPPFNIPPVPAPKVLTVKMLDIDRRRIPKQDNIQTKIESNFKPQAIDYDAVAEEVRRKTRFGRVTRDMPRKRSDSSLLRELNSVLTGLTHLSSCL